MRLYLRVVAAAVMFVLCACDPTDDIPIDGGAAGLDTGSVDAGLLDIHMPDTEGPERDVDAGFGPDLCFPNCEDRDCGDDGCGGLCGSCDDGNLCTDDSCDDKGRCVFMPNTLVCDDGDPCTIDDVCLDGGCVGTPADCRCDSDTECSPLNDDDLCNGSLFCDPDTGFCVVDPSTVIICPEPLEDDPDAPCLLASCEPDTGTCGFVAVHDGDACENEDLCTVDDECLDGVCEDGPAAVCDDDNVCTDDSCVPDSGCRHEPNVVACDDGDPCTDGDFCGAGLCQPGPALDCADDNPCTDESCDPLTPEGCVSVFNTALCDDEDACTQGEVCAEGSCQGGTAAVCDDDNVCTDDRCDLIEGCRFTPNTADCDDDNACTTGDHCAGGSCVPSDVMNCDDDNACTVDSCGEDGCRNDPRMGPCDDGDACTEGDFCLESACLAGGVLNCSDDNPCTDDSCDADLGCVHTPNTQPCDDGDLCSVGDVCQGGSCAGTGVSDCSDGNPCTADLCVPSSGCTNPPLSGPCDDGDPCTTGDACTDGVCAPGGALVCDDGNLCTQDWCLPGVGCQTTNLSEACNDGDACTVGDFCVDGDCVGESANCDDRNPCTDDSCDTVLGCVHDDNTAACDDYNDCTNGDVCADGVCAGTGSDECDDEDPCTRDICVPGGGCEYEALSDVPCDDGNACTTEDLCQEGSCVAGASLDCDDDEFCTADSCVDGACVHTPLDGACDDGDACTIDDICQAGACVSGAALSCPASTGCRRVWCDPAAGCQSENLTGACDDGDACTTDDVCTGGSCVSGSLRDCADDNPCTDDSCDSELGCVHGFNTEPCDDGNACTLGDVCGAGSCVSGSPRDCDDDKPCTRDTCSLDGGCEHEAIEGPCSDGDACTSNDYCAEGLCVPGTPVVCQDHNACTDDGCVEGECLYEPNTGDCDDGNACTLGDFCSGGECLYAEHRSCDDEKVCTNDSCDVSAGCVYEDRTGVCDDGDACTEGDLCQGGDCVGETVDCDDHNDCMSDSCDSRVGCLHVVHDGDCDDGDVCTTGDTCFEGLCQGGGALVCDDGDPCTADFCDSVLGCTVTNNEAPCDDNDACTLGDHCSGGECLSGDSVLCDDENPCTDDSCDSAAGCVTTNNSVSCDDHNDCTVDDTCVDGDCVGTGSVACDDHNDCTRDICLEDGGCSVELLSGVVCSDDNPCTVGDMCQDGDCVSGAAMDCDDLNPCTDDVCDGGTCVHDANTASCDDGNACTTGDRCEDRVCVTTGSLNCNDHEPCTDDDCDEASGCVYGNNAALCDDGDACTTGDTCVDGNCVGGVASDCDDLNPCTDDSCDEAAGCVHVSNTVPCDDNNACTTDDVCLDKECRGNERVCADETVCTKDSCDRDLGCVFTPVDVPCSDGDPCTGSDACVEGECVGVTLTCDDFDPCTDDFCEAGVGCGHAANTAPCDDGDACTTNDVCFERECSGSDIVCDDQDPCTDDACDRNLGCTVTYNEAPCDDADFCTENDVCQEGVCVPGTSVTCDDHEPCTDDDCVPATGCVFVDNTLPCDDHNDCTTNDVCTDGSCVGAGSMECDDDDPCTRDICLTDGGCSHETLSDVPCSDESVCTTGDTCVEGLCVPTGILECGGGDACNEPTCDALLGCGLTPIEGACDDEDRCTVGDACDEGLCVPGEDRDCSDEWACTVDSCDELEGCLHEPDDDLCADEDPCTDNYCDPEGALAEPDADGCVSVSLAVDCVMGPWSPWSACTASCGGGSRARTRSVDTEASCGGLSCSPVEETQDCNTQPCPEDCQWRWSAWSACAGECPTGTHSRELVVDAEPVGDGVPCPTGDDAIESEECSLVSEPCDDGDACTTSDSCTATGCVGTLVTTIPTSAGGCDDREDCTLDSCVEAGEGYACVNTNQPVDCSGHWTDFGVCEVEENACVGTRSRSYVVDVPASCGGAACTNEDGAINTESCLAASGAICDDSEPCTTDDHCDGAGSCAGTNVPVDCVGSWGAWTGCSREDDTSCMGSRSREYTVATPASCDGAVCDAAHGAVESESCPIVVGLSCDDGDPCTQNDRCDGAGSCAGSLAPVDCVGYWTEWSGCANPDVLTHGCMGTSVRSYVVSTPASCGGEICEADEGEVQTLDCGIPADTPCAANEGCILGFCNGEGACVHRSYPELCDDEDPCTVDSCEYGARYRQWGHPERFVDPSGTVVIGCEERAEPGSFQARRAFGRIDVDAVSLVKELGAHANSPGSGSVRLSLFAGDETGPGALIVCAEPVDVTGTTQALVAVKPFRIQPGIYWLAVSPEGEASFSVGLQAASGGYRVALALDTELDSCESSGGCHDETAPFSYVDQVMNVWIEGGGSFCSNEAVPVACEGAWIDAGVCVQDAATCFGHFPQNYVVSAPASCGGAECPYEDGESRTLPCPMPVDTPCDDGVDCTVNEECSAAYTCEGSPSDAACDDSDACTSDFCTDGTIRVSTGYPERFEGTRHVAARCNDESFGGDPSSSSAYGQVLLDRPLTVDMLSAHLVGYYSGRVRMSLYAGTPGAGAFVRLACSEPLDIVSGNLLEAPIAPINLTAGVYWIGVTVLGDLEGLSESMAILSVDQPGARAIRVVAEGAYCDLEGDCRAPDGGEILDDRALNVWMSGEATRYGCEHESLAVDCEGTWSDDGGCVQVGTGCIGEQTQIYGHLTSAYCGGVACPHDDGATQTVACDVADEVVCDDGDACTSDDACDGEGDCLGVGDDPVDCVGSWATTSGCVQSEATCLGTYDETFQIAVPAACGGASCEAADGDMRLLLCDADEGESCDAGGECTSGDSCDGAGSCAPGTADDALCDDEDECTADACVPALPALSVGFPDGFESPGHLSSRCELTISAHTVNLGLVDVPTDGILETLGVHLIPGSTGMVVLALYEHGAGNPTGDAVVCAGPVSADGQDFVSAAIPPTPVNAGRYWIAATGVGEHLLRFQASFIDGERTLARRKEFASCDDVEACRPVWDYDTEVDNPGIAIAVWAEGPGEEAYCEHVNQPVDCMGSWGLWSDCAEIPSVPSPCNGRRQRLFTVTTPASCGGATCEATDGTVQTEDCYLPEDSTCSDYDVCTGGDHCDGDGHCKSTPLAPTDCVGAWGEPSDCVVDGAGSCTGTKVRTFAVTTPAACGGEACDAEDGETRTKSCNMPVDEPCDDGGACTVGDACDGAGNCVAGAVDDSVCDDENECTTEQCAYVGRTVTYGFPEAFTTMYPNAGGGASVGCGPVPFQLYFKSLRRALRVDVTVDSVITGAGAHFVKAASGQMRFSLFTDDEGLPGVLLVCADPVSVEGLSTVSASLPSVSLTAGAYWLAVEAVGTSSFELLAGHGEGLQTAGDDSYPADCDSRPTCQSGEESSFGDWGSLALGLWLEAEALEEGCVHGHWFANCEYEYSAWSSCEPSEAGSCTGWRSRQFLRTSNPECDGSCTYANGQTFREECDMPAGHLCSDGADCTQGDACNEHGGCVAGDLSDAACFDGDLCTVNECEESGPYPAVVGMGSVNGGEGSNVAGCAADGDGPAIASTILRWIEIPHPMTLHSLGAHIEDYHGSSHGMVRLGVLSDNSGRPGTVLAQTAATAVPSGTATIQASLMESLSLSGGRYWLAIAPVGTATRVGVVREQNAGATIAGIQVVLEDGCSELSSVPDGAGAILGYNGEAGLFATGTQRRYTCATEDAPPTHCVGVWGDWGECQPDPGASQCKGVRYRSYEVTTPAFCGGVGCDYAHGDTQSQACSLSSSILCDDEDPCTDGDRCDGGACVGDPAPVDCVGAWSAFGDCQPSSDDECSGKKYRSYFVVTPASCGGVFCPYGDGARSLKVCYMPDDTNCDDEDPCTGQDTCDGSGDCVGIALTSLSEPDGCDDGDACTDDFCLPGDESVYYGLRDLSSSTYSTTATCVDSAVASSTVLYGRITVDEPTILTHLGARGNGSGSGAVRLALFADDGGVVGARIVCAFLTTPSAMTGAALASIADTPVPAGDYWVSVTATSSFHVWTAKGSSARHMTRTRSDIGQSCVNLAGCPPPADTEVEDDDLAVWASSILDEQDCVHIGTCP